MRKVYYPSVFFAPSRKKNEHFVALKKILSALEPKFSKNSLVGIKVHWGERGNRTFLEPEYAKLIANWVENAGGKPFVFDTTVLYSGGRRNAIDSLMTALEHKYTAEYLGCPVVIADGLDGKDIVSIDAGYKHFKSVEVARVIEYADAFVIFSHLTGHVESGVGACIKNISMGFSSRAQKQRIHSDAHPVLKEQRCVKCGTCADVCPAGAVDFRAGNYPLFDLRKCIGCAQCIAMCPSVALKIFWETDHKDFQEKLVETASAVWRIIRDKSVLVNAGIKITGECDCMSTELSVILDDIGFWAGYDPVAVDWAAFEPIAQKIDELYPHLPWRWGLEYAEKIGMGRKSFDLKMI